MLLVHAAASPELKGYNVSSRSKKAHWNQKGIHRAVVRYPFKQEKRKKQRKNCEAHQTQGSHIEASDLSRVDSHPAPLLITLEHIKKKISS